MLNIKQRLNIPCWIGLVQNKLPNASSMTIIPFRYDIALDTFLGMHFPACHLQQFANQTSFGSSPQYCFDELPSFQIAPAHPFPLCIPLTNVGRDVQSNPAATTYYVYSKSRWCSFNRENNDTKDIKSDNKFYYLVTCNSADYCIQIHEQYNM